MFSGKRVLYYSFPYYNFFLFSFGVKWSKCVLTAALGLYILQKNDQLLKIAASEIWDAQDSSCYEMVV